MPDDVSPPSDLLTPPPDLVSAGEQKPPSDLLTPPNDLMPAPVGGRGAGTISGSVGQTKPPASPPDKATQAPPQGFLSTFGSSAMKGVGEALTDVAHAPTAFADRPQQQDNSYVGGLLQKKLSEGYNDPNWWAASIGHGLGSSSPSLGLGVAGGLAGTAIAPGAGTLIGGATGFALGSALQTIAPAYQAARAAGLDHDAAVTRALTDTGIASAFGAAMGLAPGVSFFGKTIGKDAAGDAVAILKRPVSEALAQMFGAQPALGAAQQVAEGATHGQMPTADELATGYVGNVGMGLGMVGAHKAIERGIGAVRGSPENAGENPTPPVSPPLGGGALPDPTEQAARDRAATGQTAAPGAPPQQGQAIGLKFPKGPSQRATVDQYFDGGNSVRLRFDDGSTRDFLTAEVLRDQTEPPPPMGDVPAPAGRPTQGPGEGESFDLMMEGERAAEAARPQRAPSTPALGGEAIQALQQANALEWRAANDPNRTVEQRSDDYAAAAKLRRQYGASTEPTQLTDEQQAKLAAGRAAGQNMPILGQSVPPIDTRPEDFTDEQLAAAAAVRRQAAAERAAEAAAAAAQKEADKQAKIDAQNQKPPRRPDDLLDFLSQNGGVRDDTGDLAEMGADQWHLGQKFRRKLMRDDGQSLPAAFEKANQAGYGPYHDEAELLDAMRENLAGNPQFAADDMTQAGQWQESMARQKPIRNQLLDRAHELGLTVPDSWSGPEILAEIHEREGMMTDGAGASDLADRMESAQDEWFKELHPDIYEDLHPDEPAAKAPGVATPPQGDNGGVGRSQPAAAGTPGAAGADALATNGRPVADQGAQSPSQGIVPSTPEPRADIAAQIRVIAGGQTTKDAVFVARDNEDAIPHELPPHVVAVARPEGVLLTTNPEKAERFRDPKLTDNDLGALLGYPVSKSEAIADGGLAAFIVRGTDAEGNVVAEALTSPQRARETATAIHQQTPADGKVTMVSPIEMQQRRDELVSQEGPPPIAKAGTRAAPVKVETAEHIAQAERHVNQNPTEGQKEAGNYAKGHLKLHGLDITIENPKGSVRRGVGPDGKPWEVEMPAAYGYIKRTEGADGDHVDAYIGSHPESDRVFVVDQHEPGAAFDEHKAFIGFADEGEAMATYRRAFSDGSGMSRLGHFAEMSVDEFRDWLKNGDTTAPAREHAERQFAEHQIVPKDLQNARQFSEGEVRRVVKGTPFERPKAEEAAAAAPANPMEIHAVKHTKTGADLFAVKLVDRVEGDRFKELSAAAKKLGGYYSAFRGKGAVPGWQFKTAAEAARFVRENGGGTKPAENESRPAAEQPAKAREPQPQEQPGNAAAEAPAATKPENQPDLSTKLGGDQRASESENAVDLSTAAVPAQKLFVQISGRRYPIDSPQQASEIFSAARDRSGLGASEMPTPLIVDGNGRRIGYLSYNGRVWEGDPRTGVNFSKLVFDPGGEVPPPAQGDLLNQGTVPKSNDEGRSVPASEEAKNGVQASLPGSDAGAGAADVQRAPPQRPTGRVRPAEDRGSLRDAERPDGEGAEGQRGPAEEPRGVEGGGESSAISDAGVPAEARPGDGGAAGRSAPDRGVTGKNFTLDPGAVEEARSPLTKARDNVAAIELAKKIIAEDRAATREEQGVLAKYVGWGGLSGAFPHPTTGEFGKGLEKVGARLKELLTDDEHRTAARSTQYAHYTAENVIRGMWDAVGKMGFKGGLVFEPGMGIGHFLGMMPPDMAERSKYQGVEMDHLTADIAKLLYPESGVRQADFTKTPIPDNTFDLVIGNPPFSDTVIKADPKYAARGFMLHDYFFAKSLDSVRPGGLLGFVTSAGTMNKLDAKARQYMADRAEFVGGVRLPSSAFKQNAGTEVTTDVLFFKKRPGVAPFEDGEHPDWTQTVQREFPGRRGAPPEAVNVSRYFAEHPEQVLGEEGLNNTQYATARYGVEPRPGQDLTADLSEALDRLPKDVMEAAPSPEDRAALDFAATEKKDGSYYLQDGKLMQYSGGAGWPVEARGAGVKGGMTTADMQRVRQMVPVRDALRDVFRHDLARNDEGAAEARQRLNRFYDNFVRQFGPINKANYQYRRPSVVQAERARAEAHEDARDQGRPWDHGDFDATPMIEAGKSWAEIGKARQAAREAAGGTFNEGTFDPAEMPDTVIEKRPNIDPFMDDPESYRLRSIENYNEATGESSKKRIFTENILTHEEAPRLASAGDGVMWSLNKFGRLDLDAIASEMGKDRSAIIDELGDKVFRVPGTSDTYITHDEYLSGDVVDKLATARALAETDPEMRRNVAALEKAQPAPLSPAVIHMRIGMPWLPAKVFEDFARDHLGMGEADIKHSAVAGGWSVSMRKAGDRNAEWGTDDRSASQLLTEALNKTPPKIYRSYKDANGSTHTEFDAVATQAAQDKYDAIRNAFDDFIKSDPARADELAALYNDKMNRTVLRQYDGSYLTTPGISADWQWRPHQQRGIARIVQSGNTYLAHAVGAGKTSEAIGAIMEMRRLGLVRKPMIAVPGHMLGQFAREFYEQYPMARIAIADERRFHTDRRKQFMADVAQNDLDAVIITHSSFGMIPISDEFQAHLIEEEVDKLREALADVGDGQEDRFTRKRIENQIEKMEQKLSTRGNARQDQTNTFEEMGIDHLTVDEAHKFRKLSYATRQSGLKGLAPEGSNMAWDLYSKLRYLDSQKPGRSAVLMSGTPITNTMGELYTLSRFLQPEELERRGLAHFDSWAATFGDTKTGLEQTPDGGYAPVTRFASFVNVPELYKMVGQVMDTVTPEQLEKYVVRPKLQGGERQLHLAPRTDFLDAYQADLGARMQAIKDRKGPAQKGDDILLSVINDGRHSAIDPRFVDPAMPSDPDSKLNMMIDNVHRIWKETKNQQFFDPKTAYEKKLDRGPATQMIFANLGIGNSREFSGYQWIKSELLRRGVPRDQIAFIADYKTAVARQKLFNDVNEGKVRILVGSTDKMGTGVNAQRRLIALHNQDPLWFPADDEQRVGRALRQGNTNPEIGIHDYSTKGTYDSTMWQMMGRKGRFIEQFFRGDPEMRDMEDLGAASMYEQASAMATSDPRVIELTEKKQELDKMLRRQAAHENAQYSMREGMRSHESKSRFADKRIAEIQQDIAQRQETRGKKFAMTVNGQQFEKRSEAAVALAQRVGEVFTGLGRGADKQVGTIGGFPLMVRKSMFSKAEVPEYFLLRNGEHEGDLNAGGASGVIAAAENHVEKLEEGIEHYQNLKREAAYYTKQHTPLMGQEFKGGDDIARLKGEIKNLETGLTPKEAPKGPVMPVSKPGEEGGGDGDEGPAFQRGGNDATDTPAFKRWFGGSKVVDDQGKPLVVYHGSTSPDMTEFKVPAFFTTSKEDANFYHHGDEGATTYPSYLRLENPLEVNDKAGAMKLLDIARKAGVELNFEDGPNGWSSYAPEVAQHSAYDGTNTYDLLYIPRVREAVLKAGYDGVVGSDVMSNYEIPVFIALKPEQIKSATGNRGTFDPKNPDIAMQRGEGEPPIPEGHTRLYRAGAPVGAEEDKRAPWIREAQRENGHLDAEGRWFTQDRDALDWYKNDSGQPAQYVDVPHGDLEKHRVSNSKETVGGGRSVRSFSRDPENEFFLPREVADQRKPLERSVGEQVPVARGLTAEERPTETYTAHEAEFAEKFNAIVKALAPRAEPRVYGSMRATTGEPGEVPGKVYGASFTERDPDGTRAHIIAASLERDDPAGVARHEVFHHVFRSGLLDDAENRVLDETADRQGWVDAKIKKDYGHLPPDRQREEGIAEAYRRSQADPEFRKGLPGAVQKVFYKINLLLRRVGAMARQVLGKDATADDIFQRIESGEVGRRGFTGDEDQGVATAAPEGPAFQRGPRDEQPTVPPGGKDYLDDVADQIAETVKGVPPGTYARRLAQSLPSSGSPLGTKMLGRFEKFVIQPRTLAATDWRSARYWEEWRRKDQTANTLRNDWSDKSQSYTDLSPAQRKALHGVEELDRINGVIRPDDGRRVVARNEGNDETEFSKPGQSIALDAKTTAAYHDQRALMRDVWHSLMDASAKRLGWHGDLDPDAIRAEAKKAMLPAGEAKRLNNVADLMEAMQAQEKTGYTPLMRFGDYYIAVKPKEGTAEGSLGGFPETRRFELVESKGPFESLLGTTVKGGKVPAAAAKRIAELQKRYGDDFDIEHGYLAKNADALRKLDIPAVEKLFMALGQKDSELFGPMVEQLRDKMYEEMKAGFKKRARTVPGYSADFARARGSYLGWTSNHAADMLHGEAIRQAQEAYIDRHPDKDVQRYWRKWSDYQNDPGEEMAKLRQFGFYWALAGNPSSMALIATHGPMVAHATLGVGHGYAAAGKALYGALAEGIKNIRFNTDHGLHVAMEQMGRTPAEKALIASAMKTGQIHAAAADDIRGLRQNAMESLEPVRKTWGKMLNIAASTVAVTDQMNRVGVLLAEHRLASKPGALARMQKTWGGNEVFRQMVARDGLNPETAAKFMVDEGLFVWGKRNRAPVQRGAAGTMLFQFRNFEMNYLGTMWKMMNRMGPQGKGAALFMLAGLGMLGGASGLPFAQDLEKGTDALGKLITGIDPMAEAKIAALLEDAGFSQAGAEAILKGPSRAALGIDLTSRLGFGEAASRNLSPTEALGVVPSMLIERAMAAHTRATHGQPEGAAAELLPTALRSLMRGTVVLPDEGVRTQKGATVIPKEKVTAGEKVAQSLGFQPANVARAYEARDYAYRAGKAGQDLHSRLLSQATEFVAQQIEATNSGDTASAAVIAGQLKALLAAHPDQKISPKAIKDQLVARQNAQAAALKHAPKGARQAILNNPYVPPE